MPLDDSAFESMQAAAMAAATHAHAPYSRFRVGAAVQDDAGRVFGGCNVENASLGITSCAERNAIASAIAAGARSISRVLVYTPGTVVHAPCGACRQAIFEFAASDVDIVACCDSAACRHWLLSELLPEGFRLGRT